MNCIIWSVLWALFLIVELLSPAFFALFFSFGALFALVLAYFDISLVWQLVAFSLISVLSMLLLRQKLKTRFDKQNKGDAFLPLGQGGMVTKDIAPDMFGEIELNGSFWKAFSKEHLQKGDNIIVCGTMERNDLIVEVKKSSHERSVHNG